VLVFLLSAACSIVYEGASVLRGLAESERDGVGGEYENKRDKSEKVMEKMK